MIVAEAEAWAEGGVGSTLGIVWVHPGNFRKCGPVGTVASTNLGSAHAFRSGQLALMKEAGGSRRGAKRSLLAFENERTDSCKTPEAIRFLAGTECCRRIEVPRWKSWFSGRERPRRMALPAGRSRATRPGRSRLFVPDGRRCCRTRRCISPPPWP